MARIRYLKPTFFTSDTVAALPPLTRLLFQGLWCLADRDGLLLDRPARIRVEVAPYDKINVEAALKVLVEHGFICRYEADGVALIHVSKFHEHQKPHHKEPLSTLHPCPVHESCINDARSRARAGVTGTGTTKGMENGEREQGQEQEPGGAVPVVLEHPSGETVKRPNVYALYEGMGWTIPANMVERLNELERDFAPDWLRDAFQAGAEARARNLTYIQRILDHWKEHGRDCECMKPRPKGEQVRRAESEPDYSRGVNTGAGLVVMTLEQEFAAERARKAQR